MIRQRTLRSPVRVSGIGLHSGQKVYMSLLPAAPAFAALDYNEEMLDIPAFLRAQAD